MNELCDKAKYQTKEEAQAAATASKFNYKDPPKLKLYQCKECGLWHLATDYSDD